MSDFNDINFDKPPAKAAPSAIQLWDILTIGVLLITLCIGAYFLAVFLNPDIAANPFSPQRMAGRLVPTPTITPLAMPATWTPTATPYIPPTDTPLPTFTSVYTPTLFSLVPPTQTPKPTATTKPSATPKAPYSAKVEYISSSKYRPEFGCAWQGVAGIVLDKNNAHHIYVQVLLIGTLGGEPINNITVSGTAPQYYGASGFEFQLGSTLKDSSKTLFLQLRDQGGMPLSENIYINTYNDCNRNMVFVTFRENR
jgi:hypothetical protein